MNYYNPYFIMNPARPQTYGLSSLISKLNLSNILNGTQRTLNIINQAIPIIKEAAPMMKNAKTMFKVMNEFKKIDTPKKTKLAPIQKSSKTESHKITENNKKSNNKYINEYEGPTFFI